MKCPFCGYEGEASWQTVEDQRGKEVEMEECPECGMLSGNERSGEDIVTKP